MPAGLPGSSVAQNAANPSLGQAVIMDALSGPKGSLLDRAGSDQSSTGGLSTGIGFGLNVGPINISAGTRPATAAQAIKNAGFNDDSGEGASGSNSSLIYIGGGKSTIVSGTGANGNGAPANSKVSSPVPYTAGFFPCGAGNGGSRDGTTSGRGFTHKMVTAVGAVANGIAIETGWINRTGVPMVATESAFGSALTEQVALA